MTMHEDDDMAALDTLLTDAANRQSPPAALSARVMADADRLQPRAARQPQRRRRQFWASVLGGWQGMGGLAAATCAGFWIGISPPAGLPDPATVVLGDQEEVTMEILSDLSAFGWDLDEG